jgi:hypothetical protein
MKKVLLVLGALVMVLSGVAMVSAYEAHMVNVKAHIETAMVTSVPGAGWLEFGTTFPEEFRVKWFTISTSGSFCGGEQTRMDTINYEVWVDRKTKLGGGYYRWLGDALYIGVDSTNLWPNDASAQPFPGDLVPVGPGWPPPIGPVISDNITKMDVDGIPGADDGYDVIYVALDVPVFDEYYNADTDICPKPNHLCEPTLILYPPPNDPHDRYYPNGKDGSGDPVILGAEVKIQVTNITKQGP